MDVEALRALEARLVAATGSDEDLDTEIHLALVRQGWVRHPNAKEPGSWLWRELWPSVDAHRQWASEKNTPAPTEYAPRYTASLDASVALAERCLPGFQWIRVDIWPRLETGAFASASVAAGCSRVSISAGPAVAVCLAIVRALIAKEEA